MNKKPPSKRNPQDSKKTTEIKKSDNSGLVTIHFRHRVIVTVGFLFIAGLVAGSMVFAYVYAFIPASRQARLQGAVAGAAAQAYIYPVRIANHETPQVSALAGMMVDVETGTILWQRDSERPISVASLTKLVSVVTWLQSNPDLEARYTIGENFSAAEMTDLVEPGDPVSTVSIPAGTVIKKEDLLGAALIASANNAILALVKDQGKSEDFISAMNSFALKRGAVNSTFTDPSGLDANDQASAHDMLLLAHAAFSLPEVLNFAQQPNFLIHALNSSRIFNVRTTNRLLDSPKSYQIIAAKTGHLDAKSYHLVIQAEQDGHDILLVLLGEPSDASRFSDTDIMLRWAYSAYQWQRQVE